MTEALASLLTRATSFAVVVLCLMVVYVLADIWRIERRVGKPISAIAVGLLAAAVAVIGILFGSLAIYGRYPNQAPITGGCP